MISNGSVSTDIERGLSRLPTPSPAPEELPIISVSLPMRSRPPILKLVGRWIWNAVVLRPYTDGLALGMIVVGGMGVLPSLFSLALAVGGVVALIFSFVELENKLLDARRQNTVLESRIENLDEEKMRLQANREGMIDRTVEQTSNAIESLAKIEGLQKALMAAQNEISTLKSEKADLERQVEIKNDQIQGFEEKAGANEEEKRSAFQKALDESLVACNELCREESESREQLEEIFHSFQSAYEQGMKKEASWKELVLSIKDELLPQYREDQLHFLKLLEEHAKSLGEEAPARVLLEALYRIESCKQDAMIPIIKIATLFLSKLEVECKE